jgi:hypothetical protein
VRQNACKKDNYSIFQIIIFRGKLKEHRGLLRTKEPVFSSRFMRRKQVRSGMVGHIVIPAT